MTRFGIVYSLAASSEKEIEKMNEFAEIYLFSFMKHPKLMKLKIAELC